MKRHFGSRVRWAVLALAIAALLLPLSAAGQAPAARGVDVSLGGGGLAAAPAAQDPPPEQDMPEPRDLPVGKMKAMQAMPADKVPPELYEPLPDKGAGIQSISGSYVGFYPAMIVDSTACWEPNVQGEFCFVARSYSDDAEDTQYTFLKFPTGWNVTDLSYATIGCSPTGSFTDPLSAWGYWDSNNEIYIQHIRNQDAGSVCTAYYCATITPPAGSGDALVSWYYFAGATESDSCSCDGYSPSDLSACDYSVASKASIPQCPSGGVAKADGIWGPVDDNDATCYRYSSGWWDGGDGTAYNALGLWFDQTNWDCATVWDGLNLDWNRVVYGSDSSGACLAQNVQSGFAFNGEEDLDAEMAVGTTPFIVGEFCHINKPINADNMIDYVPLDLRVRNIKCPTAYGGGLATPNDVSFTYFFDLEETNNTAPCAYPGATVCPDRVTVGATDEETFLCGQTELTIALIGFIPEANSGCTTFNSSYVSGEFITEENLNNCACLWARVITPTSVDLKRFEAWPEGATIHAQWETAQEIDNLGFNLYRSNTRDGLRVKLNRQLIPTLVPPGSPFGAVYDWIDSYRLRPGRAYFYWLEDVDIYGNATLHEPVRVRLR